MSLFQFDGWVGLHLLVMTKPPIKLLLSSRFDGWRPMYVTFIMASNLLVMTSNLLAMASKE